MKKLLALIALVAVGVYGVGMVNLSELGANRFLSALEDLSMRGEAEQFCQRLHEDLEVSIDDHTAEEPVSIKGGKAEYCEYVSAASRGMGLLGASTDLMRHNFTVERSWLHPWTVHVTYDEERTTTMSRINFTLSTESEDELTLVQTFGGVKLRRLQARAWRAE
jgi:hypothetical protein